ncbi:MAG: zinc-dependent alcohol dehydrogenase family protein [Candidatus Nanopelagicales bacterium]
MIAMELRSPGPVATGRRLTRVERPDPVPGPGEVLIAVSTCAVCRTDLQIVEGDLVARRLPIVPGHQVVGRITAIGDGVDPRHCPVGQRVGVAWTAGCCGTCRFCTAGRENLCPDLAFTGWDRDGGFATAMTARADFVHPMPAGFDDLDAAPLLCGGTIGYRSLHVAGVDLAHAAGIRLGLYGFGASATIVIQLAVHAGVEVYVATRSRAEQQAARQLGAIWAGGYGQLPPVPLDAAITFAPSGDVVVAALTAVDRGGIVAINAIHLDRIPQFDYDLLWLERSLRSVANVTRQDVAEFLELAAAIPIRTRTEVFGLAEADTALARLFVGQVSGAAVLAVG